MQNQSFSNKNSVSVSLGNQSFSLLDREEEDWPVEFFQDGLIVR